MGAFYLNWNDAITEIPTFISAASCYDSWKFHAKSMFHLFRFYGHAVFKHLLISMTKLSTSKKSNCIRMKYVLERMHVHCKVLFVVKELAQMF